MTTTWMVESKKRVNNSQSTKQTHLPLSNHHSLHYCHSTIYFNTTMSTTATPMEVTTDKENVTNTRKTATSSTATKTATTTTTSTSSGGYQMPWIEKYRPRTLDDVVGNEETVSRLRAIAETGNLPNLILSGPPGSGKTTSIHALARQLLTPAHYKDAVLELNASDARGIDVSWRETEYDVERLGMRKTARMPM